MQFKTQYFKFKNELFHAESTQSWTSEQKHLPPRKHKMLCIIYINDKLQSYDKSLSVNLQNVFKREGWSDTNSFAIEEILLGSRSARWESWISFASLLIGATSRVASMSRKIVPV